jgi:hypothetical protein
VRLDAEDAQRAAALKRSGVKLSDIVREAIRAEHARRLGSVRTGWTARNIMAKIYEECPDPPGLPARSYEVSDRRAATAAIVRKLRKGRE